MIPEPKTMVNEAEDLLIDRRPVRKTDTSELRIDSYDIIIVRRTAFTEDGGKLFNLKSKVNKNGKGIKTDYRQTPKLT